MALQTANQFQLTSDPAAGISQGLQLGQQFRQTQLQPQIDELRQKAAAGDPQALTQLSGIAPAEAQKVQQFQLGQQESQAFAQEQRFKSVVQGALSVQLIQDPAKKLDFLKNRRLELQANNLPSQDTDEAIALFEAGDITGGNALIDRAVNVGIQQGIIKAPTVKKEDAGFTLGAGQQRFDASGNLIASGATVAPVQEIPSILLEGLSEDLASKGAAAYKASGGGKDGLASFQKVIDKGSEQERRLTSPKLIQSSFPQASEAETVQLQAAMDAARTTETGLKAAGKIREEQRRLVKVQGFQDRSIVLLDKVLASDELGDVLGSIEGTIDFRLQDSESELIADIEEVGDILTADNLKLMSGVLSESDIKILRNLAGGGLKRTRTEERFRADVQAIRDEMAAKRVLTVDEQASKTQSQDQPTGTFAINQQTGQRLQLVNGAWVEVE